MEESSLYWEIDYALHFSFYEDPEQYFKMLKEEIEPWYGPDNKELDSHYYFDLKK